VRAELRHPENPGLVAAYGHDRALSWWAEVRDGGRLVTEYDALTSAVPTSPAGVIEVLVGHGFFAEADLHEARGWLAEVEDVDEIDDPGTRLAAEVIVNLKKAGSA